MSVTIGAFRTRFPEFDGVDDSIVQAFLDDAGLSIAPTVWGDRADLGNYWLAAWQLSMSPFGQNARMDPQKTSTYETVWRRLQREVSTGFRVC